MSESTVNALVVLGPFLLAGFLLGVWELGWKVHDWLVDRPRRVGTRPVDVLARRDRKAGW